MLTPNSQLSTLRWWHAGEGIGEGGLQSTLSFYVYEKEEKSAAGRQKWGRQVRKRPHLKVQAWQHPAPPWPLQLLQQPLTQAVQQQLWSDLKQVRK